MGAACSKHEKDNKCIYKFHSENVNEWNYENKPREKDK